MNKTFKLALLATAVTLCAAASQAQTLRWANQGDPQTMDPHSQNEGLTNAINNHYYEALIGRDEKLGMIPSLAEKWTQTGPLTWRFNLRKGVKFHDGSPFTADDVVFSIERAAMPTSQIAVYARALGTASKVDDFTVDFKMTQPNPIFLDHAVSIFIMSKAWSVKNKTEKPLDYKNKEETFASRNANGTGPFILKTREPDIKTTMSANPTWWGNATLRKGNVKEIIFTSIKNDQTRLAALLSDGVNLVQDPAPQDAARLITNPNPAIKIINGPENRAVFFGFDQMRDELLYSDVKGKNPFKDKRVRQAVYQAIDIEALKKNIMRDQAAPTGCITPSPLGCTPEVEKRFLPFDLAASKKLLTDAGYPDGFGVTLDCPNNRYVNDEEICIAVVGMLAKVGIKTKLTAMPRAQYFPKLEKNDTSFYMLGWGGAVTDAQTTLDPVMRSFDAAKQKGSYNYGRYTNAKLDALIDASAVETDVAKRKGMIRDAMIEHRDQVHNIPLHRQFIPWAARSNVDAVHFADNYVRAWYMNVK